jgi:hypothetical protein
MTSTLPAAAGTAIAAADERAVPVSPHVFLRNGQELLADPWPTLDELPAGSTFAALLDPKRLARLKELPDLRVVVAWRLKEAHLEAVARLPKLDVLCLIGSVVPDLGPLVGAARLRHLSVIGARKLASLRSVAELPELATLLVEDAPRLGELPDFGAAASSLRGLVLREGWTSKFVVKTLAPLAALKRLEHLELYIAARDDSLRPLHALRAIRHLGINWGFPIDQLAALRAAFPALESERLEPYLRAPNIQCQGCDGEMLLLAGRRSGVVCPTCDAPRLERHVAKFEELVSRGPGAAW